MTASNKQLYEQREKRVNDVIQLKIPDRVPIAPLFGYFPALYKGISIQECMYDYDKMKTVFIDTIKEFEPDLAENPVNIRFIGSVLDALAYKPLKWAGHGLSPKASYQYVEGEYMMPDEYDAFLQDPTDFMLRVYWPRIMGAFEPFKQLPPIHDIFSYYLGLTKFAFFHQDGIADALQALSDSAREASKLISHAMDFNQSVSELGFPPFFGSMSHAPFDTISDFLRGTAGCMLDMYRQPDKILEAMEKLLPMHLKMGLSAKQRGINRVFIPLHKGLDGFMSIEQFNKFWWPTMKRLIEGLIEGDCVPFCFWEGNVESRLEIIGDIPKGKAVYMFENTDLFKAKEVLGDTVCLKGNVPLSILATGTTDDVKTYCKKLIDIVGKGGGFIMDSSTVLDDAKPDNIRTMFKTTKEYGRY